MVAMFQDLREAPNAAATEYEPELIRRQDVLHLVKAPGYPPQVVAGVVTAIRDGDQMVEGGTQK
jgi:hypothetical protein